MNKLAIIALCSCMAACGGSIMTADELISKAQKDTSATLTMINKGVEFTVTPSNVSPNNGNILKNPNPFVLMYLPAPKEGAELGVVMAGLTSKMDAEKIKGKVTIRCSQGLIENNDGAVLIVLEDCTVK